MLTCTCLVGVLTVSVSVFLLGDGVVAWSRLSLGTAAGAGLVTSFFFWGLSWGGWRKKEVKNFSFLKLNRRF